MANVQYIYMLLFLGLIVFVKIQITDGRQLKTINDHEFKKTIKGGQSPNIRKDALQVNGEKDAKLPSVPTQRKEVKSSEVSHSTDFRPTTPGSSPGIGHFFSGQKDKTQPKTTMDTDDFRPTVPGHSPGIGHSFRTANEGPNA